MRLTRVCLFLMLCFALQVTAGEKAKINWQKRVSFRLAGQGIGDAVTQLLNQGGVRLVPMRDLASGGVDVWHYPYRIIVRNMPLKQAVAWVARLCGGYYHISGKRVVVSTGYSWVDRNSFAPIFPNVETLIGPERDIDAFDSFIKEMCKITTLLDAGYFVRLEQNGEEVKLVANFPKSLLPLINKALSGLEVAGELPVRRASPIMSQAQQELIGKLYKPVLAAYSKRPLWEIVEDLSRQSGVNIGYDQPLINEKPVTLDLGKVSLREAMQKLVKQAGFMAVLMSEPNGLWLSRSGENWAQMPDNSMLWADNAVVKCYDLKRLGLLDEGQIVAHEIRRTVSPRSWFDPLACALFHKPSGKLLVIAGAQTVVEVERFLSKRKPSVR